MHLLDSNVASFLKTQLAKRMLVDVPCADACPSASIPLAGRVAALEFLIVSLYNLGVFLTINIVRKVGAAGKAAWPFRLSWHCVVPSFSAASHYEDVRIRLCC